MPQIRVLTVSLDSPDHRQLEKASKVLIAGGLVVVPTETRYGLLTRGDSREALERLFCAKGRPEGMPTSIFARNRDEIERFGQMTNISRRLMERFLPGPLTLVVRADGKWEPQVVMNERIGIRWSPSKVIAGLLGLTDFPLTATSANLSGMADAETVQEIAAAFGESVNLYLDGGPLKGITSTVVDCTGERPMILRDGAISREQILESVKDLL